MINVAIAGCGSITRFRHAPEYSENQECTIAGFYDAVSDRAQELVDQYGGQLYLSFDDLLNDPRVDAVSICTANKYHAAMSIQALKAGKHVLCEKPMSQTIQEAEDMIRAAAESKKYLMIGHNQRLSPAHVKAFELVKNGEIGTVLTFKTCFGHGGPERWSIDKNNSTWFFDKTFTAVGSLGDLGVHKIDLMRWLLQDEFAEVSAMTAVLDKRISSGELIGVDDNVVCLLKTKSGKIGTLTTSWTYYGEEDNSTTLYGTKGIMKIYAQEDFPIVVTKKDGSSAYFKVGKIATNDDQTKSGIIDLFVASINNGHEPPINGFDGLSSIKVMNAILESAEKKCIIAL
jgi:predicted dehydrogenase